MSAGAPIDASPPGGRRGDLGLGMIVSVYPFIPSVNKKNDVNELLNGIGIKLLLIKQDKGNSNVNESNGKAPDIFFNRQVNSRYSKNEPDDFGN